MNNDELTKAWATLTAQLTNAAAQVDALTEGRDASERAEGYRFLTRILVAMTEFQVEQDANPPSLVQVMSPIRKFFVDNPDTLYHRATLNPALRYRIHGRRGEELYLAFCLYGLRGRANCILANVCHADMVFDDDGRFELVLSAERPDGVKNWVQLDNIARTLVTRQYFTDLRQKPAELNIELLDDIAPPPAPTVEGTTHRLRALSQSLSRTFKSTQLASEAWMKQPNTVSVDSTEEGLDSLFPTPDNEYVGGWYKLEEDEALVMEGRAPECAYWSVQLCSRWLESRDFVNRQIILNHSQVKLEADGSFRIVVAHRDFGEANLLDTTGHREGGVIFRWLLPGGEWIQPNFRVEKL
jgi:hypothetical protein